MARIERAPEVPSDLDSFLDRLSSAPERIEEILHAIQILTHGTLIGRPLKGGERALVIGRESRGFVALYRFVSAINTAFVLAIRSQRESGFKRGR